MPRYGVTCPALILGVLEAETAAAARSKFLVMMDEATRVPLGDQRKRFPVALPSLSPGAEVILRWPEVGFMVIPHVVEKRWNIAGKAWKDASIRLWNLDQPGSSDDLAVLWAENNPPEL